MRIAFLHASPISTINPTCVITLMSIPIARTPETEKSSTSGTIRITDSGSRQLSYKAAKIRKTKTTHCAKVISAVNPPTLFS